MLTRRTFLRLTSASGLAVTGTELLARTAARAAQATSPHGSNRIEHVVILMMENRSFDHFLSWLPGAGGRHDMVYQATDGNFYPNYPLAPDFQGCGYSDPDHSWEGFLVQHNFGKMDGFLQRPTRGRRTRQRRRRGLQRHQRSVGRATRGALRQAAVRSSRAPRAAAVGLADRIGNGRLRPQKLEVAELSAQLPGSGSRQWTEACRSGRRSFLKATSVDSVPVPAREAMTTVARQVSVARCGPPTPSTIMIAVTGNR
jgi:hypothetical protein